MTIDERTPRTAAEILEYCKEYDAGEGNSVDFAVVASTDLPAMAQRVIELEEDVPKFKLLVTTLQAERDKLAAQVEELHAERLRWIEYYGDACIERDELRKALATVLRRDEP